MRKWLKSKFAATRPAEPTEEASMRDPWNGRSVSDETQFRGEYQGEGVWYECGNCDALHELDEAPAYRGLIEELCLSVGESSDQIFKEFDLGTGGGRWDVIEKEGLFKFTNSDGKSCVAPYGVISSWNDKTHSWLWTWTMPDGWIEPAARKFCTDLKARADDEGDWDPVQYGTLFVNEHEAWHLTKLAAWVNDMPLVYRAPVNEKNWHYFAIGRPTWTN